MIILGIETSCDESAVSAVEAKGDLENLSFKVLGSTVHSQIDIHREYGGVFPALAKRERQKNLPIVLSETLKKAEFDQSLEKPNVDMIAVTTGPGLEPALWVGIKFAEDLAKKWQIPVIATNHMEGHIASVLIQNYQNINENKKVEFPALALLVSGGHTELVLMQSWSEKKKIGETVDDAVGEAFDKVARMLGLPYPGGPEISRLAEKARAQNIELDKKLPRPMIHSKDYNFSFSGLKTAVLYYIRDLNTELTEEKRMAIAREFEDAVIDTLISKTDKALREYNPKTIIMGGGVVANQELKRNFINLAQKHNGLNILIPTKELSTDNATMIAAASYIEYLNGNQNKPLIAKGNLDIG